MPLALHDLGRGLSQRHCHRHASGVQRDVRRGGQDQQVDPSELVLVDLSTNIIHFTLPAALLIALLGMLLFTGAFFVTQRQLAHIEITTEMTDMIERTARACPSVL
jgi:hypothetical protein